MKILKSKHTNFTVYQNVLDCGLNVTYIHKKDFNSTYCNLAVNYGSNDYKFIYNNKEYNTPCGIAHFLEHKMFEQPGFIDAFMTLSQMGVSSNAYTNNNQTAYIISAVGEFIKPLKVMLDFVFTPFFDKQRVEDEKSIVASEINMYKDYYEYQLYIQIIKNLYSNSALENDIAGEVSDIMKITKEDLDITYEAFYTPYNMHLVIVGDFDVEKTNMEINEFLNGYNHKEFNVTRLDNIVNSKILKKEFEVYDDIQIDKFGFGIKFKVDNENRIKDELIYDAINTILFSKSSLFYQKLIDKNLVSDVYSNSISSGVFYRCICVIGNTTNISDVKNEFISLINNLKTVKISEEELQMFKKCTLGNLYNLSNSLSLLADAFVNYSHIGVNLLDIYDQISSITLSELNKCINTITLEDTTFGVMLKK